MLKQNSKWRFYKDQTLQEWQAMSTHRPRFRTRQHDHLRIHLGLDVYEEVVQRTCKLVGHCFLMFVNNAVGPTPPFTHISSIFFCLPAPLFGLGLLDLVLLCMFIIILYFILFWSYPINVFLCVYTKFARLKHYLHTRKDILYLHHWMKF